jgi:hypothetical protein
MLGYAFVAHPLFNPPIKVDRTVQRYSAKATDGRPATNSHHFGKGSCCAGHTPRLQVVGRLAARQVNGAISHGVFRRLVPCLVICGKTDGGAEGEIFGGQTLFFLLIVFCANPGVNDRKARTTSSKYKLARPKSEAFISPFLIRDNMRWRVDSSLVVLTIRQAC